MIRLRELRSIRSISLHAWKAFHKASQIRELNSKSGKAVNKKSMVSRRFYHHISLPTADSLTTYIRPLQPSSSFDFLSHVRIAGPCQIKTEELLLLTNLKNLGVLEIIAPAHELDAFPDVSDRILRSWSEAEDPFPRLVVLKIHAHRHLSERSLRYLGRFPALAVFDIAGRSGEWEQAERLAAETGWMYCDLDMLIDLPYSPDYSSREIPLTSCARATEQFSDPARFRGLDPGCWACWALVVVQMKPLSVSEDAREAWAAWAPDCSPLEVPFASLTLGPDRQALDMPARPILGITQIVFWRRSLFEAVVAPEDSAGPGETVTSLAKKARKGTSDQPTSGGQPKKRRQVGSIADVLSSFQS